MDATTSPFLAALAGEPHTRVPVWFMRQAGRHLPEYRELREGRTFEEVVHSPDLAAEVTAQPVRRYGVDAAILFSDIVTPLQAAGIDITIEKGIGPVTANPIRTSSDIDALPSLDPAATYTHVTDTIQQLVDALDVPLIGFVGAPFTLASYIVDGKPTKDHLSTRAMMLEDPASWERLCTAIADMVAAAALAQVEAGVRAVQVFDSWAGILSAAQYRQHVLPYTERLLDALQASGVPLIHFAFNSSHIFADTVALPTACLGVDHRTSMAAARQLAGPDRTLQGNLDPALLVTSPDQAAKATHGLLEALDVPARHIMNLGHGMPRSADPDIVAAVVEAVHAFKIPS